MKILGISAFYHDSSAALIKDGYIIAATQEERWTRVKHDASFPAQSIQHCLAQNNLNPEDIDQIVFYEKPFLKFERLIETYLTFAPKGFRSFRKALPLWLNEKLFQKKKLKDELQQLGFSKNQCNEILFSEHHQSHAASAFYCSPYSEALVLTLDGVGEWATAAAFVGKDNTLKKIKELRFPHSLGLLYSAFTYYCGFKVNSGEYKLMGLAPYGKPRFAETIKTKLMQIKDDGSFKLDMSYFDYCVGLTMTNTKFDQLFENVFRAPESELKQVHMDLAASIQAVTEEILIKMASSLAAEYKIKNICLAGGVALNCVANAKLLQTNLFENIWIQPAAGDAGGSLGCAFTAYYDYAKNPRIVKTGTDSMQGAFLGPSFSNEEIEPSLKKLGAHYSFIDDTKIYEFVAKALAEQKTVGWFQGRMEFGPRSLGARSILSDPRSPYMQRNLNLKIKFRESFRPFAPAVLEEDTQNYFDFKTTSPYMLMTAQIQKALQIELTESEKNYFGIEKLNTLRSSLPAITHIDYSARLQTVNQAVNPRFHALLSAFKKETGCSVLINTSFNIRGEPIVCTPEDAFQCFMGTDLDVLVIENYILLKTEQDKLLLRDYRHQFHLD